MNIVLARSSCRSLNEREQQADERDYNFSDESVNYRTQPKNNVSSIMGAFVGAVCEVHCSSRAH